MYCLVARQLADKQTSNVLVVMSEGLTELPFTADDLGRIPVSQVKPSVTGQVLGRYSTENEFDDRNIHKQPFA